ncbi:2-deoxyglucose-6-phosphate phosphatase [bacterium HR37]|jgi:HAD superfamily hydrolase (TIGR01509 family)|nr:2-deoxyglucose-6-phosphate phosphatase [bacterium HR37]
MIKAVIFDMDGVMIDSEPIWEKTEKILLKRREINYEPAYREKIVGLNQRDSALLLKETFGLPESIEELIEERISILLELYKKELKPIPGLIHLLEQLKGNGFLIALASSSPLRVINFVLDQFSLKSFFSAIVSGEMVGRGKPYPDIYLYVADKLRVTPNECVVIEDSINGVRAAKRAGMRCIAIPDKRLPLDKFTEADVVVDRLSEVDVCLINSLDEASK